MLEQLELRCDDNEQYSRRSCLRIHGIQLPNDDNNENMDEILDDCFKKVNLPFDKNDIDRAHRIGNSYIDKNSGERVKSIIVKFRSWNSRLAFYRARPRSFVKGMRKTR